MSSFDEIVAALRSNAGDGADLSPYDDLTSSYMSLTENAAASAAMKDETIAALQQEIQQLKGQNYDLLMQVSQQGAPGPEPEPEQDDDQDDDDGEKPVDDIDDLFE